MDKLKNIIFNNLSSININLDKVGAKKASRDVVKAGLEKMQTELEVEIDERAEIMVNQLVIKKIEESLAELKREAELHSKEEGV